MGSLKKGFGGGADINVKTENGLTALNLAEIANQTACIEYLKLLGSGKE